MGNHRQMNSEELAECMTHVGDLVDKRNSAYEFMAHMQDEGNYAEVARIEHDLDELSRVNEPYMVALNEEIKEYGVPWIGIGPQ